MAKPLLCLPFLSETHCPVPEFCQFYSYVRLGLPFSIPGTTGLLPAFVILCCPSTDLPGSGLTSFNHLSCYPESIDYATPPLKDLQSFPLPEKIQNS